MTADAGHIGRAMWPRICGELYGSTDPTEARVCRRPVKYRIAIPGMPGAMKRCGIHVRWYRKPGNTVSRLERP